ncbi:MAG: hypothetical protein AAF809_02235 [Bacteroidota bacterium]
MSQSARSHTPLRPVADTSSTNRTASTPLDPASVDPKALFHGLHAGPAYTPPYESPLHDEFAWHLVKYLHEEAVVHAAAQVETPGAFFTVDFLVEAPAPAVDPRSQGRPRRIAFEIGGARDPRTERLRLRRDATLLASGAVDALYRLRGSDLVYHLEDVLYLASRWDDHVFSERGRVNLDTLASWEAKTLRVRPEQPSVLLTYVVDPESEDYADPQVAERHLWHAANDTSPFVFVRRLDRKYPDVWQAYAEAPAAAQQQLRRTG